MLVAPDCFRTEEKGNFIMELAVGLLIFCRSVSWLQDSSYSVTICHGSRTVHILSQCHNLHCRQSTVLPGPIKQFVTKRITSHLLPNLRDLFARLRGLVAMTMGAEG